MCLTVNGKDIIDWSENLKLHLGVTIDGDVILILVCMLVMCVWKLARELEWSWGWGILHQLWPNYTSLPRLTCCQLVWHFRRASDTCRLERVQERGLRAVFTDKLSSYQQLLEKANEATFHIRRLQDMYFRAIFTWVSKVICVYFGFGSDWLKKLAPISQPIRSTTKTNRK